MLIVDAQVHVWAADTPERPWPARHQPHRAEPITHDELLRAMDEAGIARAVLVPPSWEGERNDVVLAAAKAHPDRFAVMGRFDTEAANARELIPTWLKQPGVLGLRFTFNREWLRPLLTERRVDWLWQQAEQYGVPVMVLALHKDLHLLDRVAERHPGLKITLDHCALTGGKDEVAFAEFDKLLPLAKRPNVAVKVSCLPNFTTDTYPFRRLHPYIKSIYDTFGPQRMFWGSDWSRLPCTLTQYIGLFTEELAWLTDGDREWIMGRGLCEWIGWKV